MFVYATLSRLYLLIISILSPLFLPLYQGYLGKELLSSPYFLWSWANFDGRHYIEIAQIGYRRFNYVFFPGYPILIKLLSLLFHPVISGITISLVCFFLLVKYLNKLILLDYKKNISQLAILLLIFFPTSFYFQSVYTESLFVLLSVLTFYFARQKKWLQSGIAAGLLTLTRHSGLAIIPALFAEWYFSKKHPRKINLKEIIKELLPMLFLAFLGFAIFLLYLQITRGDALIFKKSFSAWGRQEFTFLPVVFYRYFKILILVNPHELVYWIAVLELVSFIFLLTLSIYTIFKVRISYAVFCLTTLFLSSLSGTFLGTPRYALHLFPVFIALSQILLKKKGAKQFTIGVFLILGFLLTVLFTRGYFVS
ncbi:hypothetical protein A2382_04665 [Candidatus Woesebacteria bacterium RIFOXYB1_FULL_38_16]|uniref:Glycosyltransferase RgtA/B/C/D-like domain-containing protein n=1 Tax=Candidatus Woesebacteria bacterium RIFOXYB1_FULL_38_16 TaxID=1802538 RepID=A0A1F8CUJ6_9BACT|nr:MAG: hypothetical protein A2191_02145 [Candidatus Woesebacteria bacterium RIFOXYA1_FULL_38_9]OGM79951.1 MAG: hypothetical protein A2382_04665 [Candidatus Woesebacteria bacterium RIFOXYB1_FULL_38_16]